MNLSNPLADVMSDNDALVVQALARLEQPVSGRHVHRLAAPASYSGVRLALERLRLIGLVFESQFAHAKFYRINRDHLYWAAIDRILSARSELALRVREHFDVSTIDVDTSTLSINIFGSVGRGDSTAHSDIDLAVIYENEQQRLQSKAAVEALTYAMEQWTGNEVQLYDVTQDEFRLMIRASDPLVDQWVLNSFPILGPSIPSLHQSVRQ